MNTLQRYFLVLAIGLFVLTSLYPPWRIGIKDYQGQEREVAVEWGPVWSPPYCSPYSFSGRNSSFSELQTTVLLMEWGALTVVTTGVYLALQAGGTRKEVVDV